VRHLSCVMCCLHKTCASTCLGNNMCGGWATRCLAPHRVAQHGQHDVAQDMGNTMWRKTWATRCGARHAHACEVTVLCPLNACHDQGLHASSKHDQSLIKACMIKACTLLASNPLLFVCLLFQPCRLQASFSCVSHNQPSIICLSTLSCVSLFSCSLGASKPLCP